MQKTNVPQNPTYFTLHLPSHQKKYLQAPKNQPPRLRYCPPKTFHLHCGQTRGSLRWWWKLLTSPRWRRILGCCARGSNGAARLRPVATVVAGTTGIRPLTGIASRETKQNMLKATKWQEFGNVLIYFKWSTMAQKKHVAWCQPAWAQVFEMYAPVCMANILPSTGASSVASIP